MDDLLKHFHQATDQLVLEELFSLTSESRSAEDLSYQWEAYMNMMMMMQEQPTLGDMSGFKAFLQRKQAGKEREKEQSKTEDMAPINDKHTHTTLIQHASTKLSHSLILSNTKTCNKKKSFAEFIAFEYISGSSNSQEESKGIGSIVFSFIRSIGFFSWAAKDLYGAIHAVTTILTITTNL